MDRNYDWKFSRVGGVTRVNIESGEDLVHLAELDQKMWTALSCPVAGLEFDSATLGMLDADSDGKIRACEVVAASSWLGSVLKDVTSLTARSGSLSLAAIDGEGEEGRSLLDSARRVLDSLGKPEADTISIADTSDSMAIFAATKFNGDGVITEASTDDESLKKTIAAIIATMGSVKDRSGADGVAQEQIDAFYKALAEYSAWVDAGKEDILPYGADTAAALAACDEVKAKLADYFMRCKLVSLNADSAASLDVTADRIAALSASDLSASADAIAELPLARLSTDCQLALDAAVNPAWSARFAAVKALVLDKEFAGKSAITEAEWNATLARFDAFRAWNAAKAGTAVESLGIEAVAAFLKEGRKAELDALVAADKALEPEFAGIQQLDRLVHLHRDFYSFVRNFVTFADFYDPACKAVFQAGKLYIDQRCCELCVKVTDMDSTGSIAALSGMYVVYCNCVAKAGGAKMTIAAVVTDGDVDNLRVGKNAVFYDRSGADWDATIVKIIDNPISIRQAFWSPYKKLFRTITDRINKSASDKSAKVDANLAEKANTTSLPASKEEAQASGAAGKSSFDIAKFAGIFAAIGMAVGFLTSALANLVSPWYNIFIVLVALVVFISGPSMFLAWQKLRKRNISPVLNVNGWALNSSALVNTKFGATLTSVAHFPLVKAADPFADKKKCSWWKVLVTLLVIAAGVLAALHFTGVINICCCCFGA